MVIGSHLEGVCTLTVAAAETAKVVGYAIEIVSVGRHLGSRVFQRYPVELGIFCAGR